MLRWDLECHECKVRRFYERVAILIPRPNRQSKKDERCKDFTKKAKPELTRKDFFPMSLASACRFECDVKCL